MTKTIPLLLVLCLLVSSCNEGSTPPSPDAGPDASGMEDADFSDGSGDRPETRPGDAAAPDDAAETPGGEEDAGTGEDAGDYGEYYEEDAGDDGPDAGGEGDTRSIVVVTFNTGLHPTVGTNGFTAEMNQYLDQYYGNGLSWGPAIDEAREFLSGVRPDVVVFQEIFPIEQCDSIPPEARRGFVCEGWSPGTPTVAHMLLGPDYQVACNRNKHDKCAAVKKSFGTFRGCGGDYCADGLFGTTVDGCGNGARIGRTRIEISGQRDITLVHVHGSSGVSGDDVDCRVRQVEQVFVDLGDGEPAANRPPNLIMGDFNTDPRSPTALALDASARRWADFVGDGKPFHFVNEYVKTYKNAFCIDNVVSDGLSGSCWYPGHSEGHPEVSPEGYFDHTPTVCTIPLP